MKKRIITCILTITLISMLLVSCTSGEASTKTSDMFEYIGYNSEAKSKIVYDTETKVMYAVVNYKSMTLLVDENGKPKLWKE